VCSTLEERHLASLPYTAAGPCIIAVNPYRVHAELYSEETKQLYSCDAANKSEDQAPHIYMVSAAAVSELHSGPQVVLVSGESGAGKTETTKHLLSHLHSTDQLSAASERSSRAADLIFRSTVLLEAFGNAKTIRNDNSSRFGKFINLAFGQVNFMKDWTLSTASLTTYLLEKSRVTRQAEGERNFHVFYQLLGGAFGSTEFSENEAVQFVSGGYTEQDAKQGESTAAAINAFGMSVDSIQQVLRVILLLGQLEAVQKSSNENEGSRFVDNHWLTGLSELLQCKKDDIQQLCAHSMKIGGESIKKALSPEQAIDNVHGIAKTMYTKLFHWIVTQVNRKLCEQESLEGRAEENSIGILDIFGFEILQENGFEQLCINLCNERLQQLFNDTMLLSVQTEYEREGIEWEAISAPDGSKVVSALQASVGSAFSLLEEECLRPKGGSATFVSKLVKSPAACTIISGRARNSTEFVVHHYAGQVVYTVDNWVEINRDILNADAQDFLESKNSMDLLKTLAQSGASSNTSRSKSMLTRQFRTQLDDLIHVLASRKQHYIRCVKPHAHGTSKAGEGVFDGKLVLDQLRANGVVEALCVARQGWPDKLEHANFVNKFGSAKGFRFDPKIDAKQQVENVLASWGETSSLVAIGKTKVFFGAGILGGMSRQLAQVESTFATLIQATVRGHLERVKVTKLKRGVVFLQAHTRCTLAKLQFMTVRNATLMLQRVIRCRIARQALYQRMQTASSIRIQAWIRGTFARTWLCRSSNAATTIQALARGHLQNMKFKAQLEQIEKQRSIAGLQELVATLQTQLEVALVTAEQQSSKQSPETEKLLDTLREENDKLRVLREIDAAQLTKNAQEINRLRQENALLKKKIEQGTAATDEELESKGFDESSKRTTTGVAADVDISYTSRLAEENLKLHEDLDHVRKENARMRSKLQARARLRKKLEERIKPAKEESQQSWLSSLLASPKPLQPRRVQSERPALASLPQDKTPTKPKRAASQSENDSSAGNHNNQAPSATPGSQFLEGLFSQTEHLLTTVKNVGAFILDEIDPITLERQEQEFSLHRSLERKKKEAAARRRREAVAHAQEDLVLDSGHKYN